MSHTVAVVRLSNVDHQNRVLEYQRKEGESCRTYLSIRCSLSIAIFINLEIDELRNKTKEVERRRNILKWLSTDDFEETHDRHFKKRFENTGQWLLDDPRFRDWRDGTQSSLLWCYGARKSQLYLYLSMCLY